MPEKTETTGREWFQQPADVIVAEFRKELSSGQFAALAAAFGRAAVDNIKQTCGD